MQMIQKNKKLGRYCYCFFLDINNLHMWSINDQMIFDPNKFKVKENGNFKENENLICISLSITK